MTKDELTNEYLDWMYQLVYDERYSKNLSYLKLLYRLYKTEFTYIVPMDSNRKEDGVELRHRFRRERAYDDATILYLCNNPCSILEMLVALAVRCEEQIMSDPDIGNRTGQWFWGMIENLGLLSMDDTEFDIEYVDYICSKLLMREYAPNGEGGLFTINDCRYDLRTVEIWYQLGWYLNTIL